MGFLGNGVQLWEDLCAKGQVNRTLTVKSKENKDWKNRIFKDFGTTMKGITYIRVMELTKEEERKEQKKNLKQ